MRNSSSWKLLNFYCRREHILITYVLWEHWRRKCISICCNFFLLWWWKCKSFLQYCCFYYVYLYCAVFAVKSDKFNVWWNKVYSVYASEHVATSFIMCGTHYFFNSFRLKRKKNKPFLCFCLVHEINFSKAQQSGEQKRSLVIAFHLIYHIIASWSQAGMYKLLIEFAI